MHKELSTLLLAIQNAGDAILQIQPHELDISKKANNEIVTKADLLANDILKAHLLSEFPEDAWLSEETIDDASRLSSSRVWVVDPIDGTKEFALGLPEYAISVALIEHHEPVLAAVYNPATQELFHAVANLGTWQGTTRCQCLYQPAPQVLASRTEYDRGQWEKYNGLFEIKKIGSIAYKLALVASGAACATFSIGNKNEWDIAAGVLLVKEAGGVVLDNRKQTILFNQQNLLVDGIFAASANNFEQIYTAVRGQV